MLYFPLNGKCLNPDSFSTKSGRVDILSTSVGRQGLNSLSASMSVFKAVPERYDFPAEEANIVSFWKEREIFAKSLEQRAGSEPFVFYEGPPTANGMPHLSGACAAESLLVPELRPTTCGLRVSQGRFVRVRDCPE